MRYSRRHSLWDTKGACYFRSALLGMGVILLCLIGFSAIMTKVTSQGPVVSMMANVALCIGCMSAGYTAAKNRRKNGILTGIYTGAIIYAVIYLFGVIVLGRFASMTSFTRLIMVAICSAIGGILGVNTKIRRPPR